MLFSLSRASFVHFGPLGFSGLIGSPGWGFCGSSLGFCGVVGVTGTVLATVTKNSWSTFGLLS